MNEWGMLSHLRKAHQRKLDGIFTRQSWELYETSGIKPSFKIRFIFIRNVKDLFLMNFNHTDMNVP